MGQLGPLGVAVLGLLAGQPLHPYEVSFRMRQQHLDRYIKLNFGSLYHAFDQLRRQGLIEPELAQVMRQNQADWCRRIADEIDSEELEWYAGQVRALGPPADSRELTNT